MIFQFLDIEPRQLTTLAEPTEVHQDLVRFADEHPKACMIVRGQPEGNYILIVR